MNNIDNNTIGLTDSVGETNATPVIVKGKRTRKPKTINFPKSGRHSIKQLKFLTKCCLPTLYSRLSQMPEVKVEKKKVTKGRGRAKLFYIFNAHKSEETAGVAN